MEVIANVTRQFVGVTAEEMHLEMITAPHNHCGYTLVRITHTPCAQSRSMSTVVKNLLLAMEYMQL